MKKINWGILSTGTIAKRFATTFNRISGGGNLLAVASRDGKTAGDFAGTYNIPRAYESYAKLAADPDIDVIYIATPHSLHYENAKLCLAAGKNVLCEKSFTVNAAQAAELVQVAQSQKLFIMEAFWTKFLPAYQLVDQAVSAGTIGEITHFRAQYGFAPTGTRYIRKFDPNLAGGALLDIGVYALGAAAMLLGYTPKNIHSSAIIGEYGTDQFDSIMLEYPGGTTAHLITTIGSVIDPHAVLFGTKGRIDLPNFSALQEFTITLNDGTSRTVKSPFAIDGFEYQITETENCLLAKKTESAIMTHQNTLDIMKMMDKVRSDWKLKFPCEK